MAHDVGMGLFEEIAALRLHLGNARCLHGVKLKRHCYPDCMPDARALVAAEPGGAARAALLASTEATRG